MSTTLAAIERATARRVGPYYEAYADRQVPSTANFSAVLVPSLRSIIEQDLATDLWLLRRGLDVNGDPVVVAPADRQRQVASVDPGRGEVVVDRPWSEVPASGEVLEFHHLDPALELRAIVRAGLKRCLFEDRFNLGQGFIYEADLTAALPWLDDLRMVKAVSIGPFPTGFPGPSGGPADIPFEVFGQCGHVWLRISGGGGLPYFGGVLVTVHRPHFGWVNGADALDGPWLDDDTLNVDVEYAASAAAIEGWRLVPAKMQAAAAGNLQTTRDQAALEYTRLSFVHRLPRYDLWSFRRQFGMGGRLVVINS